jgi:predicted nucleic acid-binding protein
MKKIFLDTNILIDIMMERDAKTVSLKKILPYLHHSQIYLSTLSIHISFYSLKIKPNSPIHKKILNISKLINLVPLSNDIINQALNNFSIDFEDTLQYYSALDQNCNYILTRDKKDFNAIKKLIPSKIEIIDTLNTVL